MSTRARNSLIAFIATTAMISTASTAIAVDQSDPADRTADLIAQVAPSVGAIAPGALQDDVLTTAAEAIVTTVPLDPSEPITVEDAQNTDAAVSITLPPEASVRPAQIASDGTVVYASQDESVDVAVQTTVNGDVRLQTIIPNDESEHSFTYTFGGDVTPVLSDDGVVILATASSEPDTLHSVGAIAPAWAFDADGMAVPSTYAVDGNRLIQTVSPGAAVTYPIVADPTVTIGIGYYVYFSKAEVKDIANSFWTNSVRFMSLICAPMPIPVNAACMISTQTMINSVINTFKEAKNANKRVELHFLVVPGATGVPALALVGWKPVS